VIVRRALSVFCATAMLCGTATAATAPAPDILPLNYQPPPDSDEAGLWMMSDQLEKSFKMSPLLVRDPALNDYVKGVVCKVAPDRCPAIRVYILDVPYFNAAMSPNGAMQVWTGLLLRVHNEAQLALVLGHETSHYTLRHTISLWRRARSTSGFLTVFTLATAGVGALVALAAMGSLMAYSRDEEREADKYGIDMATAAGYAPDQDVSLWREQVAEENTLPKHDDIFAFTHNHPAPEERLVTMQKRATELESTRTDWIVGREAYQKIVQPFRSRWLEEDLALGHYEASIYLLTDLLRDESGSGELRFYLGEVYRRRNGTGDAQLAVAAYQAAIADGGAPPTVYRGLGITEMKTGDKAAARQAFEEYLAASPDAGDRGTVEYYLSTL
jgi:Peptidase family M48